MGIEEDTQRGWKRREDMAEDLSSWFCQLSTQERLQAIAVDDVIWIRLFNVLYRKHKSWMSQRGTPPTWEREKVRKIYERLQRNEQNRVAGVAAAAAASASSDAATPPHEGARAPPPSFVPPPRTAAVAAGTKPTPVETGSLDNGGPGAAGGYCSGGGGSVQSALQVGERLNDAVRLCSLGCGSAGGGGGGAKGEGGREGGASSGPRGALTLSEAELSKPRRLLNDLRLLACRPSDGKEQTAAAAAASALPKSEQGKDVRGKRGVAAAAAPAAAAEASLPAAGCKAGFLTPALAEEEARWAGASADCHDPLMETAWLAERFPKATLGDLLVNRLELSLWASYWGRRRPRGSVGGIPVSPLASVAQEAGILRGYWRTLPLRQRHQILEGLPEAAALASDSCDSTARNSSSSSSRSRAREDVVQCLMFAPAAWCFQDDGAAVKLVVGRLRRAYGAHVAAAGVKATPAIESPALEPGTSSDDSNAGGGGGGGDDFAIDSATAATTTVGVGGGGLDSSDHRKKQKKRKKKQKNASTASAAAAAASSVAAGEASVENPPVSGAKSLGERGVAAQADDGAAARPAGETSPGPSEGSSATEEAETDSSVGANVTPSASTSATAAPPPSKAAATVASAAESVAGGIDDGGWVLSTSRRSKPKEAKEEVREVRRGGGGGGGGKGAKGKDGGSHPKATAGHRESLRDSHREPYRDRGDAPSRGSKGSSGGSGEGRHDRDSSGGGGAPWARGTSRQDSGKGDEGRVWGKDISTRDRRDDPGGTWSKSGGSRRERRDGSGGGGGAGLGSGSGAWPRASARRREDRDVEASWVQGGEEDAGPWAKRGGGGKSSSSSGSSAKENGHAPSAAGRSANQPQHTRTRSSSFADMVRGANAADGVPSAVSPLRKAVSAKSPRVASTPEATTPSWGSGKSVGAPSFATVLLGGSGATSGSSKFPPPPALKAVDTKGSASAVSPSTTVSASPVTASEQAGWSDTPAPAAAEAAGPKPAKPMAWTTGNTASVLRAAIGEPAPSRNTSSGHKVPQDRASSPGSGSEGCEGKAAEAGKSPPTGKSGGGGGAASPKAGEVMDVMVEVLDLVGDVIVRRAHSRASKAKSYAQAIAESEGRAQALATAYQRHDGLLQGSSWEGGGSANKHAAGTSDATDSVASTASATAETAESSPAVGAAESDTQPDPEGEEGGSVVENSVPVLALSPDNAAASEESGVAKEDAAELSSGATPPATSAAVTASPPAGAAIAPVAAALASSRDVVPAAVETAPRAVENGPVAAAPPGDPPTSNHATSRGSSGSSSSSRCGNSNAEAGGVRSRLSTTAEPERRRAGAPSFDSGGGGGGGGGSKAWSDRGPERDRGSNAASWARGNTPPAAARQAARRAGGDTGRAWVRSGQQQQQGLGSGGHPGAAPMHDLRGARSRGHKPAMPSAPPPQQMPHNQHQGMGEVSEEGRGSAASLLLPRAPAALRASMSAPLGRDAAADGSSDALSRGALTTQPDVSNVIPSPRILRSPSRRHRPRSSSAGSGTRHSGMHGGAGGGAGYHPYPQHQQHQHQHQQESWQNSSDWALSAGGNGGGAPRGVRSGGGGWQLQQQKQQQARDGEGGRSQYPYRDDGNLYRAPSPHSVGGGGGGGGGRHPRQEQGGHNRPGRSSLPRPAEAPQQQPQQQQQQQHQHQQHQHQQVQPARFRSRSGGAGNELSMADRRADRMEYEYNLMVSCLDRNVERFMQKLGRAMRPRRRAWSQVIARVRELVSGIWKEARVEMYGSCFTGLELPSSDVDVVVCGINGLKYSYGGSRAGYSSMQTVANLQKLANVLQEQTWVRGMKVIETAAVPVIKILADPVSNGNGQFMFDDSRNGRDGWLGGGSGLDYIPLDISFESPQHGGIASSKWVRDCIQGGKYGFALPAVMVLKEILCQRGLNQPWSGGLSSYSLINMMITVLQRAEVERARARRIVACAQAAALAAAARGVRQGPLPPPAALPLPGQVAVAPQQQQLGVMGPPPPPPSPVPPPTLVPAAAAPAHVVAGPGHEMGAPSGGGDEQVAPLVEERVGQYVEGDDDDDDGVAAAAAAAGVGGLCATRSSDSGSSGGSASGYPGHEPLANVSSAGGDAVSSACGSPASADRAGGMSDDAENMEGAKSESAPITVGSIAEHQQPNPPVTDGSYDGRSPPLPPPPLNTAPSQREQSSSPPAAQPAGGVSTKGPGDVNDQAALADAAASAASANSSGSPDESVVGGARAPTPPVGTHAVQAPQQQQQQQQQMQQQQQPRVHHPAGVAMLPSAAQQAQYNLGMNAELFNMKHMEINLSQEEVDRADLSGMTPGEVLVRFLAFFGRQFDPTRVGISVGRGAISNPFALTPSVDPRTGMPVMEAHVVIEDPLDRDQNVARSCFGFPQVQWLFGQYLSVLQERGADMAEFDRDADLLQMLLYY